MRHSTMDGLVSHQSYNLERLMARGRLERSRAMHEGLKAAWRWIARWFERQADGLASGEAHPELKRAGCGCG